ncbi:hypothetical protein JCM10207_006313 [Rhodosporidiobolus poonsookiae]
MATLLSLPPELLQLVIDALYTLTWNLTQRLADGRSLALTCRALQPFGDALLFRDVDLRGLDQSASSSSSDVFARILTRTDVPPLVSRLAYTDSRAHASPARLAALEHLLPLCTSLTSLHIYAAPSTLNRLFGARGTLLPPTLVALTLRSVPFLDALDIGPILHALARLKRLQTLDLLLSVPVLAHPALLTPLPPSPGSPPPLAPLALRSLAVAFPPSNAANLPLELRLLELVAGLVDPAALVALELRIASASPALFDLLSSFTSLRALTLHLQHSPIAAHLSPLTSTLPSLPLVRQLTLRQRVLRVPRPSPSAGNVLALSSFLDALPAGLEELDTSLYFPLGAEGAPLKGWLGARAPREGGGGVTRVKVEVPDGEDGGGGRACEMRWEGEEGWVEVLFAYSLSSPLARDLLNFDLVGYQLSSTPVFQPPLLFFCLRGPHAHRRAWTAPSTRSRLASTCLLFFSFLRLHRAMSSPAPVSRPTLDTLPRELIERTVLFAAPPPSRPFFHYEIRKREATLVNLSLTCHALYDAAQTLLWSNIYLIKPPMSYKLLKLADSDRGRQRLAQIKTISADSAHTIHQPSLLALVPHLVRLEHVDICGGFESFELQDFVKAENLETLQLCNFFVAHGRGTGAFPALTTLSVAVGKAAFGHQHPRLHPRPIFTSQLLPALRAAYVWKSMIFQGSLALPPLFSDDLLAQLELLEIPLSEAHHLARMPAGLPPSLHLCLRVWLGSNKDPAPPLAGVWAHWEAAKPKPTYHLCVELHPHATLEGYRAAVVSLAAALRGPNDLPAPISAHLPQSWRRDPSEAPGSGFDASDVVAAFEARGVEVCWYEVKREEAHAVSSSVWQYVRALKAGEEEEDGGRE